MLTHLNVLCNVRAVLKHLCPRPHDRWFSFLPLSHTFERTTTYYVGMGMGNAIVFCRSIATLAHLPLGGRCRLPEFLPRESPAG